MSLSVTENPGFFEMKISETFSNFPEVKKNIEKEGNFRFSKPTEQSEYSIGGDLLSFHKCYELLEKNKVDVQSCQILLREHIIKNKMINHIFKHHENSVNRDNFVEQLQVTCKSLHGVDVLLDEVTLSLKMDVTPSLSESPEIFEEIKVNFNEDELCKRFLENSFCLKNFDSWLKTISIENEEIPSFAKALNIFFPSSDAILVSQQTDTLKTLTSNETKQIESLLNKSEDIIEVEENKWHFISCVESEKFSSIYSECECYMNCIKLDDKSLQLKISSSSESNKSNVDKAIEQITSIYQSYENILTKEFFPKTSGEFESLINFVKKKKLFGICCYTVTGPENEIKEAEKTFQNSSAYKRSNSDSAEQFQNQSKKKKADCDFPKNEVRIEYGFPSGLKMFISKGNLIHQMTDAIVNPANSKLQHGGGAARAIADAAGEELKRECKMYIQNNKILPLSEVMHTTAGKMRPNIKYVIHTVGPRVDSDYKLKFHWYRSSIEKELKSAFHNCFMYADNLKITSVAVPAISSGIFGVPMNIVTNAMFEAFEEFERKFSSHRTARNLKEIHFVNMDEETVSKIVDAYKIRYNGSSSVDKEDHDWKKRHSSNATEIHDDSFKASNLNEKNFMQNQQEGLNVRRDQHNEPFPSNYRTNNAVNSSAKNEVKLTDSNTDSIEETCVICMDNMVNPKKLKCGHQFCSECLDQYNNKCQPKCPSCGMVYGKLKGNQPPGKMEVSNSGISLSGYEGCGSLEIHYSFYDGVQNENHPNPGKEYRGTRRTAYLPNNREGKEVAQMLRKAFDNNLLFTIGNSHTTGRSDVVVWNDIHHKTNLSGQYGYPDPTYLKRVKEELMAKGIHPGS